MKLRYYMRGLGIGIIVTAILMGVTLDGKTEKLTDAQIIERAKELGMEEKYDSTVLADTVKEETEVEENETEAEESTVEEVEDAQTEVQEIETDVSGDTETETTETETTETETTETETTETLQVIVQGGDGSQTVARKLAQAGLVEDATAYDKYLCRNGYDKRICTGTHTIPVGATEEEIAKIITSRP